VKKSLSSLNPYNLVDQGDLYFTFSTSSNKEYIISFINTLSPLPGVNCYTFNIALTNNSQCSASVDARIGDTVIFSLTQFLKLNPDDVIYYITDSSDDRHLARYRKFKAWGNNFNSENYKHITFSSNTDGENYGGVIYHINGLYSSDLVPLLPELVREAENLYK
jgi:hypothetical protein